MPCTAVNGDTCGVDWQSISFFSRPYSHDPEKKENIFCNSAFSNASLKSKAKEMPNDTDLGALLKTPDTPEAQSFVSGNVIHQMHINVLHANVPPGTLVSRCRRPIISGLSLLVTADVAVAAAAASSVHGIPEGNGSASRNACPS
jgi:hypothetical protein